jgi:hypothetical protein
MVLWLFIGVQKPLQINVFFLLTRRACLPLCVWVGVRSDQIAPEICILSVLDDVSRDGMARLSSFEWGPTSDRTRLPLPESRCPCPAAA